MRRFACLGLPALALACVLVLPEASSAQWRGFRGGYGGYRGGYGGYRGGYGGYRGGYDGGYYGGYAPNYGYGSGIGLFGRNFGGYPYYGSSPYNVYGYSPGYVYQSAPIVVGGGVVPAGYQSAYPPTAQGAQLDPSRGLIRVRVPADAQVMIDNNPTTQTGADRLFETPSLDPKDPGATYKITASWTENGKERREDRNVAPIAGQTVLVDFMQPASQPAVKLPRE